MTEFNRRYLEFCKPFIEGLKDIYKTMMAAELTTNAPRIKDTPQSLGDYSAVMGINGSYTSGEETSKFKGALIISWPEKTYLKTASAMLMEEFQEYNEEISDVGMEICNMTMGNAKKILAPLGYKIDMTIPTAIKGPNHELHSEVGVTTIITPLSSSLGDFFIELNYEDEKK